MAVRLAIPALAIACAVSAVLASDTHGRLRWHQLLRRLPGGRRRRRPGRPRAGARRRARVDALPHARRSAWSPCSRASPGSLPTGRGGTARRRCSGASARLPRRSTSRCSCIWRLPSHPDGSAARSARFVVAAVYALAATVSAGLALFRDPFFDPYCWQTCSENAFLVHAHPGLADTLGDVWTMAALVIGAAIAVVATRRLAVATATATARPDADGRSARGRRGRGGRVRDRAAARPARGPRQDRVRGDLLRPFAVGVRAGARHRVDRLPRAAHALLGLPAGGRGGRGSSGGQAPGRAGRRTRRPGPRGPLLAGRIGPLRDSRRQRRVGPGCSQRARRHADRARGTHACGGLARRRAPRRG